MERKVSNLNGQATELLFSVLRKLREHDVNTLVEAQLKHERDNPEMYGLVNS